MTIKLGVNIDHVATLRQARGTSYPDPVQAALVAIGAGADGVTMHLREDRRHIQDHDVFRMKERISVPLNLEMAVTSEMLTIAATVLPAHCCLVPEKREELTTEGGLDVVKHVDSVKHACEHLGNLGIEVSLFIGPDIQQIEAALACGAPTIEIHTGRYAELTDPAEQAMELERIQQAAAFAAQQGLIVNAGHGLTLANVAPIAAIPHMNELNIGHSMVAEAIFLGLPDVVKKMKSAMLAATQ